MASIFRRIQSVNRVVMLPIEEIHPNRAQPRRHFEQSHLEELAQSIAANGLLQPVTVRRTDQGYELIAGERRLQACKMLGWSEIRGIVEEFSDQQSAILALIENLQRRDLNFYEEALGIAQLMKQWGMTQQQVAKHLGKAQSTIANKLRLLRFDEETAHFMMEHGLTERHARALLKIEDEALCKKALQYIADHHLNVEQAEKFIEHCLAESQPHSKGSRVFVIRDVRIFLNTVNRAVDVMKQAGIPVNAVQHDTQEFIEYTVRIPKSHAVKGKNPA